MKYIEIFVFSDTFSLQLNCLKIMIYQCEKEHKNQHI